ncbi:MAG: AraC family transcriptional regulator [Clostridia bacterium]|nr:AraC family transcriptional regulator [Clostridia bacterium]
MPSDQRSEAYNQIENHRIFDIQALITAYHFPTKPNFEPSDENYDFSQIIYITSGSGTYTNEKGSFPFSPGMMFYRPAHHTSRYEWDSEQASLAVISFVCPSDAMSFLDRPPFPLGEEESATLVDLVKTGARICESVKGGQGLCGMKLRQDVPEVVLNFVYASLERFLIMVYCRLNQIELLVDESQKVNRFLDDSQLVGEIKTYLSGRLSEPLSVGEICSHFWISQTALTKKFRKETGQSVMEYFSNLKIQEAKRMIRTSPISFTRLAELLGFSSVNYFSKVFKAKVGQTPTEYSKYASKRRISTDQIP